MGDVISAQIDIINGESFEEDVLKGLVQETSEEQLRSTSLSIEGLGYKIFWTGGTSDTKTRLDRIVIYKVSDSPIIISSASLYSGTAAASSSSIV